MRPICLYSYSPQSTQKDFMTARRITHASLLPCHLNPFITYAVSVCPSSRNKNTCTAVLKAVFLPDCFPALAALQHLVEVVHDPGDHRPAILRPSCRPYIFDSSAQSIVFASVCVIDSLFPIFEALLTKLNPQEQSSHVSFNPDPEVSLSCLS